MKTIQAADFKARCLAVMEEVRASKEPVVITKRGRPVAKLIPVRGPSDGFIGRLQGIVRIVGDIESPIEPMESWETLR
jgi:prevent-host-death family protein